MGTQLYCSNLFTGELSEKRCATVTVNLRSHESIYWKYDNPGESWQSYSGENLTAETIPISSIACQGDSPQLYFALSEITVYNPLQACDTYKRRFPNGNYYYILKETPFCLADCTPTLCGSACQFEKRITYYQSSGLNASSLMGGYELQGDYEAIPSGTNCLFIVRSNGEIVHKEYSQMGCPEYHFCKQEKDENKTIEIELDPWHVLAVTSGSDVLDDFLPPGSFLDNIEDFLSGNPDECLMIWELRNSLDGDFGFARLIAQFCSCPGVDAPLYGVVCDNCQKCPENTCEVRCDDHICCYGSDGKVVKEIAL